MSLPVRWVKLVERMGREPDPNAICHGTHGRHTRTCRNRGGHKVLVEHAHDGHREMTLCTLHVHKANESVYGFEVWWP